MRQFLYLFIDLGVILVPFLFSFHPRIKFYKHFKKLLISTLIAFVPFIIWDIWFTEVGYWGFNSDYLTGINLFNLPIEEVLFFIAIPFACVYTYFCIKEVFAFDPFRKIQKPISIVVGATLLSFGFIHIDLMYTSITFISLSALIFYLEFVQKEKWLSYFYFTWILLFFPFFISNGILTGSWIDAPIVWYNPNEFIGFRIGTIPFEDTFYGMLLVMINVWWFERLAGWGVGGYAINRVPGT